MNTEPKMSSSPQQIVTIVCVAAGLAIAMVAMRSMGVSGALQGGLFGAVGGALGGIVALIITVLFLPKR